MSEANLSMVQIREQFRSKNVYGSYQLSCQWKTYPGFIDISECNTIRDLTRLWSNIILIDGVFILQARDYKGKFVNLGKITYHNGALTIKDKRCRLFKLLKPKKEIQARDMF